MQFVLITLVVPHLVLMMNGTTGKVLRLCLLQIIVGQLLLPSHWSRHFIVIT
jgi:hypothetical protein